MSLEAVNKLILLDVEYLRYDKVKYTLEPYMIM